MCKKQKKRVKKTACNAAEKSIHLYHAQTIKGKNAAIKEMMMIFAFERFTFLYNFFLFFWKLLPLEFSSYFQLQMMTTTVHMCDDNDDNREGERERKREHLWNSNSICITQTAQIQQRNKKIFNIYKGRRRKRREKSTFGAFATFYCAPVVVLVYFFCGSRKQRKIFKRFFFLFFQERQKSF